LQGDRYLIPFKKGKSSLKKAYMFFTADAYSFEKLEKIEKELSLYPNISVHKSRHEDPMKYAFNITHVKATKMHGVEIIMQKLNLKREDLIGVGDSYNDFPLLMSCGLKVAMGNAIADLKEIADYVAPSVEEDGVATVIEKF